MLSLIDKEKVNKICLAYQAGVEASTINNINRNPYDVDSMEYHAYETGFDKYSKWIRKRAAPLAEVD